MEKRVVPESVGTPSVSFLVTGENGLFADPLTRIGGERLSYMIPTYDGLRGILDSIYFKPTFRWVVERCRVLNPMVQETKGLLMPRLLKGDSEGKDRALCTYLSNVAYQVEAHMEWRMDLPEYAKDRWPEKHLNMANRAIKVGGRKDVFVGKREGCCYGYVTPCEFGEGEGYYDHSGVMQFGLMLHGMTYPDNEHDELIARFWLPVMKDGVIEYPHPSECDPGLSRLVKKVPGYKERHRIKYVEEEEAEAL